MGKRLGLLLIIFIVSTLIGCSRQEPPVCPPCECEAAECPPCECICEPKLCPVPDCSVGYISIEEANKLLNFTNVLINATNECYPEEPLPPIPYFITPGDE